MHSTKPKQMCRERPVCPPPARRWTLRDRVEQTSNLLRQAHDALDGINFSLEGPVPAGARGATSDADVYSLELALLMQEQAESLLIRLGDIRERLG